MFLLVFFSFVQCQIKKQLTRQPPDFLAASCRVSVLVYNNFLRYALLISSYLVNKKLID